MYVHTIYSNYIQSYCIFTIRSALLLPFITLLPAQEINNGMFYFIVRILCKNPSHRRISICANCLSEVRLPIVRDCPCYIMHGRSRPKARIYLSLLESHFKGISVKTLGMERCILKREWVNGHILIRSPFPEVVKGYDKNGVQSSRK